MTNGQGTQGTPYDRPPNGVGVAREPIITAPPDPEAYRRLPDFQEPGLAGVVPPTQQTRENVPAATPQPTQPAPTPAPTPTPASQEARRQATNFLWRQGQKPTVTQTPPEETVPTPATQQPPTQQPPQQQALDPNQFSQLMESYFQNQFGMTPRQVADIINGSAQLNTDTWQRSQLMALAGEWGIDLNAVNERMIAISDYVTNNLNPDNFVSFGAKEAQMVWALMNATGAPGLDIGTNKAATSGQRHIDSYTEQEIADGTLENDLRQGKVDMTGVKI